MIKIIHVISDSNIGGAGRYLLTYLRNCDTDKFQVSVAVPTNSLLIPEISKLGFDYYEVDDLAESSANFKLTWNLFKLFFKEKPKIVHTHACLSGRIAAKLAFVKTIVYTRHSVFKQDKKNTNKVAKFIQKFFDKFLSTGIIAVAEAAKENVTDLGISAEKIKVIYNGIDKPNELSEDEKKQVKEKFGIPDDYAVVSIIARLTSVKGQKYFIDAAETCNICGVKVKFVIAGTGEDENILKNYAKSKLLDDTVIFTGFLENVSELENITDIQVNASFGTEAASLSLLEGMSLGIPAVVSDFGGNPELILNDVNGYVVPQKSGQAIAEKIMKLLEDKDLYNEISICCKKIFEEKYTSKIMTEKTENFYLSLYERR